MDDHTIVEAAILPTSRRRCTRNAYSNHVMLAKLKCKKLTKDSSRKRIKRIQCSSSSDDDGERNRTGKSVWVFVSLSKAGVLSGLAHRK